MVKLEEGNVLTNWTLHPDEVSANVQSAISTAKTEIQSVLGSLAYQNTVRAAMESETLITGVYLKNTLIDTVWLRSQIITADYISALEVNFTRGRLGGFEISSNRFGSIATPSGSGGGLSIYDNFFRVGGSVSYAMLGENVIPASAGGAFTATGRIVNNKPNSGGAYGYDQANYGLFINVSGGTQNYGISSNAAIMAPAFINTKVKLLNLTSASPNYELDFTQSSIFLTWSDAYYNITLPSESSVRRMFGLLTLPADFGFVFVLKVRAGSNKIRVDGIHNHDEILTDYGMEPGDSIMVLVTKTPSFQYQILNYSYE